MFFIDFARRHSVVRSLSKL